VLSLADAIESQLRRHALVVPPLALARLAAVRVLDPGLDEDGVPRAVLTDGEVCESVD
jgi:hypothetical protein